MYTTTVFRSESEATARAIARGINARYDYPYGGAEVLKLRYGRGELLYGVTFSHKRPNMATDVHMAISGFVAGFKAALNFQNP